MQRAINVQCLMLNGQCSMNNITLKVNGASHSCKSPITLPELLTQINLNPRLVAVEYNGEILHRQFWSETKLRNSDRLEIVTIVGGG